MSKFINYTLTIQSDGVIQADADGKSSKPGNIDMKQIGLANLYIPPVKHGLINREQAVEMGKYLYNAIFAERIDGHFSEQAWRKVCEEPETIIRMRLAFKKNVSPDIISLPWEFLYGQDTFLGTDPRIALSYKYDNWMKSSFNPYSENDLPLRILFVHTHPKDEEGIGEISVGNAIKELDNITQVNFEELKDPSPENLQKKIEDYNPHVFHFLGHGKFDEIKGAFALLNKDGNVLWYDHQSFSDLFRGKLPGLMVLQSCESGKMSDLVPFAGGTNGLVKQIIPAVVGMRYPFEQRYGWKFIRRFYETLGKGEPVDVAVQAGRRDLAVDETGQNHNSRNFGVPVLWMNLDDGLLFRKTINLDIDKYLEKLEKELGFVELSGDKKARPSLNEIYVEQEIDPGELSSPIKESSAHKLLIKLLEEYPHLLVVAPARSGKSILSKKIALELWKIAKLIPIHVQFRILSQYLSTGKTFKQFLTEDNNIFAGYDIEIRKWFYDQWINGKAVLILDGYDEVPTDERRRETLSYINASEDQKIILLSRPILSLPTEEYHYHQVDLLRFNRHQVQELIEKYTISFGDDQQQVNLFLNQLNNAISLKENVQSPGDIMEMYLVWREDKEKEVMTSSYNLMKRAIERRFDSKESLDISAYLEILEPFAFHTLFCHVMSDKSDHWNPRKATQIFQKVREGKYISQNIDDIVKLFLRSGFLLEKDEHIYFADDKTRGFLSARHIMDVLIHEAADWILGDKQFKCPICSTGLSEVIIPPFTKCVEEDKLGHHGLEVLAYMIGALIEFEKEQTDEMLKKFLPLFDKPLRKFYPLGVWQPLKLLYEQLLSAKTNEDKLSSTSARLFGGLAANYATVFKADDEWETGEVWARKAEQLFEKANNPSGLSIAKIIQGSCADDNLEDKDSRAQAGELFLTAIEDARKVPEGGYLEQALALNNLAIYYNETYHPDKARDCLNEAEKLMDSLIKACEVDKEKFKKYQEFKNDQYYQEYQDIWFDTRRWKAYVLLNKANVMSLLEPMNEEILQKLNECEKIFSETGHTQGMQYTLSTLASWRLFQFWSSTLKTDKDQAITEFKEAISKSKEFLQKTKERWGKTIIANIEGSYHALLGNWTEAERFFKRAYCLASWNPSTGIWDNYDAESRVFNMANLAWIMFKKDGKHTSETRQILDSTLNGDENIKGGLLPYPISYKDLDECFDEEEKFCKISEEKESYIDIGSRQMNHGRHIIAVEKLLDHENDQNFPIIQQQVMLADPLFYFECKNPSRDEIWTHECDECGARCCNALSLGPIVSSGDIGRICKYTGMEMSEFVEELENRRTIKKDPKHKQCMFLDDSKRCKIHEARPFDCRLFPIDLIWDKENGNEKEKLRFILVEPFCPATHLIDEYMIDDMESKIEDMGLLEIIKVYAESRVDELDDEDGGYKPLRFISPEIQKKVDEQK